MSRVTCQWVVWHVNESCDMSMSRVTCQWVVWHMNEMRIGLSTWRFDWFLRDVWTRCVPEWVCGSWRTRHHLQRLSCQQGAGFVDQDMAHWHVTQQIAIPRPYHPYAYPLAPSSNRYAYALAPLSHRYAYPLGASSVCNFHFDLKLGLIDIGLVDGGRMAHRWLSSRSRG